MPSCRHACSVLLSIPLLLLAAAPFLWYHIAPRLSEEGPWGGLTPAQMRGKAWNFNFDQVPDLAGKVALVTGANSGLGYYTALHLARKGAQTVITCRSAGKCEAAAAAIRANYSAAKVDPMVLDQSALKNVRRFAADYLAKYNRSDTIVLNAGMVTYTYTESEDGIEVHLGVNHVAHQLLANLLEPTLGDKSTVVLVSSASHYSPKKFPLNLEGHNVDDKTDKYGTSKLANVLHAQELAERLAPKGVRANSCHPGLVLTNIMEPIKAKTRAIPYVGPFLEWVLTTVVFEGMSWDTETGALTQLYLAVSPEVTEGGITGKYYHPVAREHTPSKLSQDKALQKGLWEFTEGLIREKCPP